ncbi:MAG: N-acetylmuramoyl-L-alanine amidase [Defluviitaleaceae bacterium]|nr:N-acetylmuramoyl-L-alanine amidase [Defluviitaleaceae bacterium]
MSNKFKNIFLVFLVVFGSYFSIFASELPIISENQLNQNILPVITENIRVQNTEPEIFTNVNELENLQNQSSYQFSRFIGNEIEQMEFEETTVISVENIPNTYNFVINTETAISSVSHSVLYDRLVIDIHNSTLVYDGTIQIEGIEHFINSIRIAGHDGFTRVVFDMNMIVNYSLELNQDRTNIYVTFHPVNITDISISSTEDNDFISIASDAFLNFSIVQYLQQNLFIYLPLTNLDEDFLTNFLSEYENMSAFVDAIEINNWHQGVRINLILNQDISYSYVASGNTVTFVIAEPTYRNITFDREQSTLTLQTSSIPLSIDNISIREDIFDFTHTFTLNGNFFEHFGYGNIQFFSDVSNFINIYTEDGITNISVESKHITYVEISENNGYITIRTFSPKDVYDFIVMLDPGHGGHDPGAVHFGLRETDVVLTLSNMVIDRLNRHENIGVFYTRATDVFVPLADRARLANGTADLFVSLHLNAHTTGSPHGIETYFLPQDAEYIFNITREQVATIFQNNLVRDLNRNNRGIRTANFAVLRLTEMPSVLLELGFMSNPNENRFLANPANHVTMANSIYRSILDVFELYEPIR